MHLRLAFDAPPQNGVEVCATVERVLTKDAVSGSPIVEERRLRLLTLKDVSVCLTRFRRTSTRLGWSMGRA